LTALAPVLELVLRLAPDAVFDHKAYWRLQFVLRYLKKSIEKSDICDEPLLTTCMAKTKVGLA
jgi:hypothetical protein